MDSVNLHDKSMDIIPLKETCVSNFIAINRGSTRFIIEGLEMSHTKAILMIVIVTKLIKGQMLIPTATKIQGVYA